ncbi:MAG: PASTA domain-containing protein [Bacteroidetes bacterium]|nr:MAG: PASTA domain-containing protein [Bacteroidota bacterium]REK06980.1 MAG: PASTA domain-containing protein [Bacteroidota bacterium]REK33672.1 MAG: PASTA domain-containing protein [Bacteroidota bacterium]REK47251.1 MAG: PASTA domain-containing protein [Bacteroidota bacterium]
MGIFKFLTSKTFLINLAIAATIVGVGMFTLLRWIDSYTLHGESIEVPDLKGMKTEQLDTFLAAHSLRYQIIDSLYDTSKKPGTVLDQDPAFESRVKKDRTIYITVNSILPPKVKMPDLIDVSHRQAEAILTTYGFKVGSITFEPDLAKNAVIAQRYKGQSIRPGTEIPKGSVIDLVLGDGMGNLDIDVPDLTGLTKTEASFVLRGAGLNIGKVVYDEENRNQEKAKIYKQEPEAGPNSSIRNGDPVDIYLR